MSQINRRKFLLAAAVMAAGTAGCGNSLRATTSKNKATPGASGSGALGAATSDSTAGATGITVDATSKAAPVGSGITGVNGAKWYDDGLGMFDPKAGAVLPDVVAKVRRAGLGLLRYPGGTSANLFRWKCAVGPQSERGNQVN